MQDTANKQDDLRRKINRFLLAVRSAILKFVTELFLFLRKEQKVSLISYFEESPELGRVKRQNMISHAFIVSETRANRLTKRKTPAAEIFAIYSSIGIQDKIRNKIHYNLPERRNTAKTQYFLKSHIENHTSISEVRPHLQPVLHVSPSQTQGPVSQREPLMSS